MWILVNGGVDTPTIGHGTVTVISRALLQCVYRLEVSLVDATTELDAQPHPENIIPNTTQNASDVTGGVGTPPSSGESAYSIPDEYSRDA